MRRPAAQGLRQHRDRLQGQRVLQDRQPRRRPSRAPRRTATATSGSESSSKTSSDSGSSDSGQVRPPAPGPSPSSSDSGKSSSDSGKSSSGPVGRGQAGGGRLLIRLAVSRGQRRDRRHRRLGLLRVPRRRHRGRRATRPTGPVGADHRRTGRRPAGGVPAPPRPPPPVPAPPGQLPGQPVGAARARRPAGLRPLRGRARCGRHRSRRLGGARPAGRPDLGPARHLLDGPEVSHVSFADPYCPELAAAVRRAPGRRSPASSVHRRGTVVVIQGPRFSTRAESPLVPLGRLGRGQHDPVPRGLPGPRARHVLLRPGPGHRLRHRPRGRRRDRAGDHGRRLRHAGANVERTRQLLFAAIPAVPEVPSLRLLGGPRRRRRR